MIFQVIFLFFSNSKHSEQKCFPHSRLHFPFTTVYPSLGNLDFYPHEEEDWGGAGGGGGGGMAVRKKKGEEEEEEEDEELDGRRGKLCIILAIINFSVSGVIFFICISNVDMATPILCVFCYSISRGKIFFGTMRTIAVFPDNVQFPQLVITLDDDDNRINSSSHSRLRQLNVVVLVLSLRRPPRPLRGQEAAGRGHGAVGQLAPAKGHQVAQEG